MWSVIGSADYLRSISSQYKAGRSGAEGAPSPLDLGTVSR